MTTQEQIVDSQLAIGMSPKVILLAYYRVQKTANYNECYNIVARVNPSFFKDLATQAKLKLADVILLFKDSRVVNLFKSVGFSFTNLYKSLQRGFKAMKDLQVALMEYAKQSGVGKWTAGQLDSERLKEIDNWLKTHPKTKRITGALVAGMLAYIWFNMTFVGNPAFDFDMSSLLTAMGGSFSLEKIFSGSKGAALLLLFFTGSVGLTFPWPGPNKVKFMLAILGTIATKTNKRLRKAANPYLNTPPTKLKRDIKKQKDPAKKKLMQTALNAWRTTVPGPFRKTAALELTKLAREIISVARLKPIDKKIIEAFANKKPLEDDRAWVSTDGKSLYKLGMGGEKFAIWRGSKIMVVSKFAGKSAYVIMRYLRKVEPKRVDMGELTFKTGGDQLYAGQWDAWILAYVPWMDEPVGRLDWSSYQNEYSVKYVEVMPEFRRSGVATALYKKLFKDNGITKRDLSPTMQTDDGAAFKRTMAVYNGA